MHVLSVLFAITLSMLLHSNSCGPKALARSISIRRHVGQQKGPEGALPDPRWYQFAATVRLDAVRSGLAASAAGERASAAEAADVEPAATSAASSGLTYEQHRTQGVKPRGQPHVPLEELAALRPGRSSPSSFVLQRHAVMVCGRPVVVPIPHTAY